MILVLVIRYKIRLTMCLSCDGAPLYSHTNAPLKHCNDRRPIVQSLTLHACVLPFDGAVLNKLVIGFMAIKQPLCDVMLKPSSKQPGTPGNHGIPSVTACTNEALLYSWQLGFDLITLTMEFNLVD